MDPQRYEKLGVPASQEGAREEAKKPQLKETQSFKEAASSVVGAPETKDGVDAGAEFSEGKVAETTSEDKKKASSGAAGKAYTADEIEAIRAKLLANLPPQEVMMKQIEKKLYGQEKLLKKDYKKIQRMGHRAAFQLAKVVAQMRKVHEYLALMANATFEVIKQLWLKIVHGV